MNRTILARISLTSLLLAVALFGACTDQDLPTAGYIPEEPEFYEAPIFSQGEDLTGLDPGSRPGGVEPDPVHQLPGTGRSPGQ